MCRLVTIACCALLANACGPGTSPSGSPSPTGIAVAGGAGCAADHRQGLIFSGALVGQLVCDTAQPICDFVYVGRKTDTAFTGAIHGLARGKLLLVAFSVAPFSGPGAYQSVNQEGGTVITIDGPAHWTGQLGDAITVSTLSKQTLTGSLNARMTSSAAAEVNLRGTWVCDRVSSGR